MPAAAAFLAMPDRRRSARHPVDRPIIAEHARVGDLKLRIVNISPEGFMAMGAAVIERGERLLMRLPVVGRIEAQLLWHSDPRAGFRFERLIRIGDFTRLMAELQMSRRQHAND